MSDYDDLVRRVNSCAGCALSQQRNRAVPGEGSRTADIMFIGEGPGYHEDQQGRPFVGPAGKLLEELLASIGLRREDVYITNMVKCRPPNNRDPLPGEIAACKGYMDEQIEMISPKVIVTLGRFSFARFFPRDNLSRSRGRPRPWGTRIVYPMYHPAAALHNPKLQPAIESDFKSLPALIEQVVEGSQAEVAETEQSQQLSMF